ncbi:L-2-hydroxyglutarate oxidase LhgO [Marinobacter daqiaonensis]|uniref:L-2-hydroxyglutarate oxidase LhgO n=1 Tax=Marinobacter daqiaonensis TaxID=650891 RepID=A0A1I6HDC2_9GAMM|nr:NAD(P)/FAD-dependent oxidoreductase [Marinobacter daqiaonensis]SFR52381.1 L-2-hydroxyglutarate oxidase LhgO [Marinobacter daqiaonensis]
METLQTDLVVIGAGVVGLAVARELALAGQEVIVLEQGAQFGEGISSRNSEVIHGGIYYPAGSLKARFCLEGRELLYGYCQTHPVAHRQTGKWIIASHDRQRGPLERVYDSAAANGVALEVAEGEALCRALPGVQAVAGLYSPRTGIISSHELMVSLLGELESAGGQLVCRAPVIAVTSDEGGHTLTVGGEMPCRLACKRVVNAAGLGATPLAGNWQGYDPGFCPPAWYARGVYFSYSGRHPFDTLVYPVPEPGGLGVHLTLDLAGQARFGPDVEWIPAPDVTVDPGRRQAFVDSIKQWWPALEPDRLQPAYAGIRPKLAGPEAGFVDFLIQDESDHGVPGLVHLFGIESPGLTSCLAIARHVKSLMA